MKTFLTLELQYPQARALIAWGTGFFAALVLTASSAIGANVNWTDWTAGDPGTGTATGIITTSTATVGVTYANPAGYAFIETGFPNFDYFQNSSGAANSPYTSASVDNIPTAAEMIALQYASTQTLTFSKTVANPFFAYVSLNLNGYAFDRDFEILSFGDATGGGNYNGFFGPGTSYKVDTGVGTYRYQLLGTGEPHGTIRFLGSFDTVTWQSLSNEYWNGFTVGVEGTAAEVFGVPDTGSSLFLLNGAFGVLAFVRSRLRARA